MSYGILCPLALGKFIGIRRAPIVSLYMDGTTVLGWLCARA